METLNTQDLLTPGPFVILDTETASLSGGVVELAYLVIDAELNVLDEKLFRLNPGRPIEPGAQAIHGISYEEVADCPTLAEIAPTVPMGMQMIAHNAPFDARMAQGELIITRTLCTLDLARTYVKGTTNCKLETLQRELNLPVQKSHSALGDVHTVRDLLAHILPLTGVDLNTLFDRQEKPRILSKMPIGMHKGKPMLQVPKAYRDWLLDQPDLERNLKLTLEKLRNL